MSSTSSSGQDWSLEHEELFRKLNDCCEESEREAVLNEIARDPQISRYVEASAKKKWNTLSPCITRGQEIEDIVSQTWVKLIEIWKRGNFEYQGEQKLWGFIKGRVREAAWEITQPTRPSKVAQTVKGWLERTNIACLLYRWYLKILPSRTPFSKSADKLTAIVERLLKHLENNSVLRDALYQEHLDAGRKPKSFKKEAEEFVHFLVGHVYEGRLKPEIISLLTEESKSDEAEQTSPRQQISITHEHDEKIEDDLQRKRAVDIVQAALMENDTLDTLGIYAFLQYRIQDETQPRGVRVEQVTIARQLLHLREKYVTQYPILEERSKGLGTAQLDGFKGTISRRFDKIEETISQKIGDSWRDAGACISDWEDNYNATIYFENGALLRLFAELAETQDVAKKLLWNIYMELANSHYEDERTFNDAPRKQLQLYGKYVIIVNGISWQVSGTVEIQSNLRHLVRIFDLIGEQNRKKGGS